MQLIEMYVVVVFIVATIPSATPPDQQANCPATCNAVIDRFHSQLNLSSVFNFLENNPLHLVKLKSGRLAFKVEIE